MSARASRVPEQLRDLAVARMLFRIVDASMSE